MFFLYDIHVEIFAEGFGDKIFDTEIIAALGRALASNQSWDLRNSVLIVNFFTTTIAQGALHFFLCAMHTEMFADGFRDKTFDTAIVAALVRALGDRDSYVRSSAVNFFTAATAQGPLHCVHRTFVLKL